MTVSRRGLQAAETPQPILSFNDTGTGKCCNDIPVIIELRVKKERGPQ